MHVGTYPTRNFAQSCYHEDTKDTKNHEAILCACELDGTGHFCQSLHVAMQLGLYHRRRSQGVDVWRVVSEDPAVGLRRMWFPADCLHHKGFH